MQNTVKVAVFSVDPPGLSTFQTFDPESFTLISAINDALIYIDSEGAVRPGLATSWRRTSSVELELTLRQGVRFHDGEPFDADSVVATFRAHREPTPSASARGVLGAIVGVRKLDPFTVRLTTAVPDAMLVHRLFVSAIYPRGLLEREGRDYFAQNPIGTGPYRLVEYRKGEQIVLQRNPEHWSGRDMADRLELPILRQKQWVECLARGEIDVALGLDSHDRVRASRIPGLEVSSRRAAITQFFLLANRGPLADLRVRRAMNHAINRRLIADVAEHGFGRPQRSVAVEGTEGYVECKPYRYSPELARHLLDQAGFGSGIKLRGLTSETSIPVFFAIKEFLARVGVELEAEIVPRAEWIRRIVGGNIQGKPYDGDFALAVFDNPVLHTLFQHFIFLFSQGPYALLRDAEYDRRFRATAAVADEGASQAQAELERYVRDESLVLFTVHEDVHAACRAGFSCHLPRSGHFDGDALMNVRRASDAAPSRSLPSPRPPDDDAGQLLDATSHLGAFFLRPGRMFENSVVKRIWDNIRVAELRWRLQNEPLLRELVSQAEAKANLANVLDSTERVAIVGYSAEGRQVFSNKGYAAMFGGAERSVLDWLAADWQTIREQVDTSGSWLGPVHLLREGRPPEAPDHLYLSVTRALDPDGVAMGYTFVFNDFSGEEERIRTRATRTILDNVPYGLFMCGRRCQVLEGFSVSCKRFFAHGNRGIQGRPLPELLDMGPRATQQFLVGFDQVFDDVFPDEVSLANLPERVNVGSRTFSLAGSVVRSERGEVVSVLFTLLDISELIEAEHEVEALRGAVQVARHRACFDDFACRLHARLHELAAEPLTPETRALAAFELHTAKGVFGQFGLHDLARQIHAIEADPDLSPAHLLALDASLQALVNRNAPLWQIDLEHHVARYSTTDAVLQALEARVAGARSLEEARSVALAGLEELRSCSVEELASPLAGGCAELSTRRGKLVRFELEGGDVRWPQRIAPVFDVLPHLIRNSIDHGIEPPEERFPKPEVATIRLVAQNTQGGFSLRLRDDGRGIAVDRVTRRAIELGAVSPADVERMSPPARWGLIFLPGLSTAEQVTESSGRGVGMTAVKREVESLGGDLSLSSEPGAGTTVQIRFPATGPL